MIKKLLIALAALVLGFFAYVAMQPAYGVVTRSATIAAPPAAIFPHVNELKKWDAWSPWAKLDPNAKTGFDGPAAGVGSAFSWAGNSEIGEGKMTIVESKPGELVKLRLDFMKPFENTSTAAFTFKPEGDKTVVTWEMGGERPFMARAMCILFGGDKMVGDMFDKGLASLKAVAEGKA